ncbi:tetratricopeptide repeat protein [Crocosphaera watsonii]|uniref:tetratricopeptide repeat protein n=1 Tax=Crocosphaera watsonii TaxID=263511 RepID=UPI000908260A|nr:tetratricopeptide repeat protein [Crocosphaera watsonii]
MKPDDHQAWYFRGNALYNLGRYEEAIASYDQALEIKPDKDKAWYNRGIALHNLGRLEETITSWDKALEISSNDYEAWYCRGNVLFFLGKHDEALESYLKARELQLDYDEVCIKVCNLFHPTNSFRPPINILERMIELKMADYNEYNGLRSLDEGYDEKIMNKLKQ